MAAHSNSGAYTAPACLMGVLGVVTDGDLTEDSFYTREAGWEQVQIHASSRHMLPAWDGSFFETQVSNSYAAPLITARVHGILCGLPEKDRTAAEVYRRLAGRGSTAFRMRPDFVEDAVLFQTGEDRLQQEFFFFHVKERAGSLAALREAVGRDPYAPVVLVPSGSREVDQEACLFCRETCRSGFLYAGDAYRLGFLKAGNAPIKLDSGGPLFWDEGLVLCQEKVQVKRGLFVGLMESYSNIFRNHVFQIIQSGQHLFAELLDPFHDLFQQITQIFSFLDQCLHVF